jgi:hypothetical protein
VYLVTVGVTVVFVHGGLVHEGSFPPHSGARKQPPQPWPQASIPSTHRETVHVDGAVVVDVVTVVGGHGGLEKVGVLGPPHSGASVQPP